MNDWKNALVSGLCGVMALCVLATCEMNASDNRVRELEIKAQKDATQ